MQPKLWTKNFTIITLGTVISMLGGAVSHFALSLLVYERTQSTFLFALVSFSAVLPNMFLPTFVGPLLDRFSRRKAIYTLDFISSFLFVLVAAGLYFNLFNYLFYIIFALVLGCVNSTYMVAYDSFYPNLVSEGNFSKAYSISSLIYPICNTIMVPIAAEAQATFGMELLFLFTAVMYLIAAIFETQIDFNEAYMSDKGKQFSRAQFIGDFKEGIAYLKSEASLSTVAKYFFLSNLCSAVLNTLLLPFFSSTPGFSTTQYAFLMSTITAGRIIGGIAHYYFRYPVNKKYQIAVTVYAAIAILDMTLLFTPYTTMIAIMFITGLLGVTSFNIRTSATQSYVSDDKRARFNGIFMMITFFGSGIGQLLSGFLGDYFDLRYIVFTFMAINLVGVFLIMVKNKKAIKFLYNRSV